MTETLTSWAPLVGAMATVALGLFGLLFPRVMGAQTGLSPKEGMGVMELRAIFGGLWLALGTATLMLRTPEAYLMTGLAFTGVTLGRFSGIAVDRMLPREAWGATVVDGSLSLLLLSGYCMQGIAYP